MEDCEKRLWSELIPELQGLIFKDLSLEEKLTVIPRVCKSWRQTMLDPYCWQEINLFQWSPYPFPDIIYRMLEMLIQRSDDSVREICVILPDDSCLSLIAEHGKVLHSLELIKSRISSSIVESVAEKFPALTYLDLSYCKLITASAIEAIGKYCSKLAEFRRLLSPYDFCRRDDEAIAIASTMHNLKHLKIALNINTELVVKILENCQKLEFLDCWGCCDVKLDKKLIKKFSRVVLLGPLEEDSEIDSAGWLNY